MITKEDLQKLQTTKNINLGCGNVSYDDCLNIDISSETKADIIIDFKEAVKVIDDNQIEVVRCENILTQICSNEDFFGFMNEVHRIVKADGLVILIVASVTYEDKKTLNPCAFQDPNDCRKFCQYTWDYFNHTKHEWQEFGKFYGIKPWKILEMKTNNSGIMCGGIQPIK